MSDTVLKFIPVDPTFIPAKARQVEALELLEELLPDGEDADATVYDAVSFIDNGVNTEAVLCSACGARTAVDDDSDLLSFLSGPSDADFMNTSIPMPCCGERVAVTSLQFDWAAGFAQFELSIWNPNTTCPVDSHLRAGLAATLGCELREIWAHY
jgi:hypothetical protein